jgi:hypothetical protein
VAEVADFPVVLAAEVLVEAEPAEVGKVIFL